MASFAYFNPYLSFALAITLSIFCLSILTSADISKGGFSVELIHRDSPKSPLYNSQETPSQRLAKAFQRSATRLCRFYPTSSNSTHVPESQVYNAGGEYIMKLSIGIPPSEIFGIADTGSDLIWTQCLPCKSCYKQDVPLFKPNSSKTYNDLSCSATACQSLQRQVSCSSAKKCTYQYSYGDGSYTVGNLASDTLTFNSTNGQPVSFPKIVFGCGHNNYGSFSEHTSGIVGLGGGSISLITQLGSAVGGKFSYCLTPFDPHSTDETSSSALNFGSNDVASELETASTPLFSGTEPTFYNLQLEAVSVGATRVEYNSNGTSGGNIIIDSGTTLTIVPQDFYQELESAVVKVIGGKRIDDPNGQLYLCYDANSHLNYPNITVHFKGADVKLNRINTFLSVADGVVCFTFVPAQDPLIGAIYGNVAQANFLVIYDLQGKTVSFKATNCASA